jgi:transcription elongation factor Elf1
MSKKLQPARSDESTAEVKGVGHFLGGDAKRNTCPKCGSTDMVVRNYSLMWGDGQVHCSSCGEYVRRYDSG